MQTKHSNKLLNSLTKKELSTLKNNYEINDALIEKGLNPKAFDVVVKFFNPTGIGTWYLTELSPDAIGFGLCHPQDMIGMPERKNFVATDTQTAEEGYYGTLLHELIH